VSKLKSQTQVLQSLKKHHSDKYGLDYYDINELTKDLADAYWKDHMVAARPLIVGTMSVYTLDYEVWRERYLKQLRMSDIKFESKP
jgi:hypothetical protein